MDRRRVFFAVMMLVVGAVQAWDSHVLDAGTLIIALVYVAVVAPPTAFLATRNTTVYLAVLAGALAALLVAKFTSAIALPALGVALIPGALPLLFHRVLEPRTNGA